MGRRNEPRVYWVDYVTEIQPKMTQTARIVAESKLSKAELKAKMIEHDISSTARIVKIRSEAID